MSAIITVRINSKDSQRLHMTRLWNQITEMVSAGQTARLVLEDGDVRSLPQNDRMWAMLADISRQVNWHGNKLSSEEWKHVFSSNIDKQKVVPNLDGTGFVVMGISTRKKSKKWFNDMFALMEAFGAERDVKFSAPEWIEP